MLRWLWIAFEVIKPDGTSNGATEQLSKSTFMLAKDGSVGMPTITMSVGLSNAAGRSRARGTLRIAVRGYGPLGT